MTPEIVIIGHLVQDVDAEDASRWRLGGTAAYAGALAHALGLRVGVLTAGPPELLQHPSLAGVQVRGTGGPLATRFCNRYEGGQRSQWMLSRADQISPAALPDEWRAAPRVLLGPVCGEVDEALAQAFPAARVGACLQGWLREVDATGRVHPRALGRWPGANTLLDGAGALFLSADDLLSAERQTALATLRSRVEAVLYTHAERGADVFWRGDSQHVEAFATQTVDPTGAGDIFAAAFMIAWQGGDDIWQAARFAACAASFIVEAEGLEGLPTRAAIEQRYEAADRGRGWRLT